MEAAALLRPSLLEGCVVALGGGTVLGAPLAGLGARTYALPDGPEDAVAAAVDPATTALLHDVRPGFADGGHARAGAALEAAWTTVRGVANGAFIPEEGGRIVLVAPPPDDADPAAAGLRAAVENLARTLSIEWARHAITTVALAPGPGSPDDELSTLAAYLASPAGGYFSGTALTLTS